MRYSGHNTRLVHRLHYSWTGWPKEGSTFPAAPGAGTRQGLVDAWAADGLAVVGESWSRDTVHFTFEATPELTPTFLAARAKGRLQHAMRQAGSPITFSRKVSLRALGENVNETVERYLAGQVDRSDLADPRFRRTLEDCSLRDENVRLDEPTATDSGRYWYNLHLVLVTVGRYRMGERSLLTKLRDAGVAALRELGCATARFATMPDHVHVALRGAADRSPKEIGLAVQNATAVVAGCRCWQDGFYVGTFGEYELGRAAKR